MARYLTVVRDEYSGESPVRTVLEPFMRPGGFDAGRPGRTRSIFCGAPHPTDGFVWCRRMVHDDGDHSAFRHSIRVPETWPREGS